MNFEIDQLEQTCLPSVVEIEVAPLFLDNY